jgi:hypothetical protein
MIGFGFLLSHAIFLHDQISVALIIEKKIKMALNVHGRVLR